MTSLTFWNRIEPRPEGYSIEEGLSAKVRDPLWMLARQSQMGEFHGEDAGSPAFVEISVTESNITGTIRGDIPPQEMETRKTPIEVMVEDEAFTPDLSVRVEMGESFEALLSQELAKASASESKIKEIRESFRETYPIQLPSDYNPEKDQETAKFLSVCLGRAMDGVNLYQKAIESQPSLPPIPIMDSDYHAAVRAALDSLILLIIEVFRNLGLEDPKSWIPERLEYGSKVAIAVVEGGSAVLSAEPDSLGDLDWYAYDLMDIKQELEPPTGSVMNMQKRVIPAHVKFRGMANPRWWDFERWITDFGDIRPEKQDIARLVVMEFMLVQGIDWFTLPMDQKVGTTCRVNSLVVTDVFGGLTEIKRADDKGAAGKGKWTIFSTTAEKSQTGIGDIFILSPSTSAARQTGPIIEDVRFLRDETANMAWGVENMTEDGIGQPWPGHERALAAKAQDTSTQSPDANSPPISYLIQTTVPENWIPFIPVSIDPANGRFMLQRSGMLGISNDPLPAFGRILQPTSLPPDEKTLYRIFEEEVPRSGVRIYRERCRSRWTDGSTHIWINRRASAGTGEGSSGLKFDQAI